MSDLRDFRYALLILLSLIFIQGSLKAQDIPFSEKFFPDRVPELKAAVHDMDAGDEFFTTGKTVLYKYAIPFYESAYRFNPSNALLTYKLGTCYLMARKRSLALEYLQKAVELNPEITPDVYYYLGFAQQQLLQWDDAIASFFKYGELIRDRVPVDNVSRRIEECRNGKLLTAQPLRVRIENLGVTINTSGPEYTPLITADESRLFFTSRRQSGTGVETDREDLDYFEDIYYSDRINNQWTLARNLGPPVNTPGHDAGAGLSPDGKMLFVFKGSKNNGDIMVSKQEKGTWSEPEELGKNISTRYHESSACITADGKTLYFSSDRPGGYGGRDLYKSEWDADKKMWGPAFNLGSSINSAYDEEGVFIHPNGSTLYFSSKGHNSMGGYDVFYSVWTGKEWLKAVNAGYPINSPDDDVYFVVSGDGNRAYLSTAREDSFGETDLYRVLFLADADKPVARMLKLSGTVSDANSGMPLNATLEVIDLSNQASMGTYATNPSNGQYTIILDAGHRYGMFVYATNYLFESPVFDVPDTAVYRDSTFNIRLKSLETGNNIVLNNVFFETDKATLTPASTYTLNKLVKLMKDYPELTADISGHTDSDGKDDYNLKLSENRARSVVDYLVTAGISKNRLTSKGYGKTRPLVPNTTPENKAMNRRIEFRVTFR